MSTVKEKRFAMARALRRAHAHARSGIFAARGLLLKGIARIEWTIGRVCYDLAEVVQGCRCINREAENCGWRIWFEDAEPCDCPCHDSPKEG